jgi:hypothetical protein
MAARLSFIGVANVANNIGKLSISWIKGLE